MKELPSDGSSYFFTSIKITKLIRHKQPNESYQTKVNQVDRQLSNPPCSISSIISFSQKTYSFITGNGTVCCIC